MRARVCMCACARAYLCPCMRLCVCVCVRACVRACGCVRARALQLSVILAYSFSVVNFVLFLSSIRNMLLPERDKTDSMSLSGTKMAQSWTSRSSRTYTRPKTSSQVCTSIAAYKILELL